MRLPMNNLFQHDNAPLFRLLKLISTPSLNKTLELVATSKAFEDDLRRLLQYLKTYPPKDDQSQWKPVFESILGDDTALVMKWQEGGTTFYIVNTGDDSLEHTEVCVIASEGVTNTTFFTASYDEDSYVLSHHVVSCTVTTDEPRIYLNDNHLSTKPFFTTNSGKLTTDNKSVNYEELNYYLKKELSPRKQIDVQEYNEKALANLDWSTNKYYHLIKEQNGNIKCTTYTLKTKSRTKRASDTTTDTDTTASDNVTIFDNDADCFQTSGVLAFITLLLASELWGQDFSADAQYPTIKKPFSIGGRFDTSILYDASQQKGGPGYQTKFRFNASTVGIATLFSASQRASCWSTVDSLPKITNWVTFTKKPTHDAKTVHDLLTASERVVVSTTDLRDENEQPPNGDYNDEIEEHIKRLVFRTDKEGNMTGINSDILYACRQSLEGSGNQIVRKIRDVLRPVRFSANTLIKNRDSSELFRRFGPLWPILKSRIMKLHRWMIEHVIEAMTNKDQDQFLKHAFFEALHFVTQQNYKIGNTVEVFVDDLKDDSGKPLFKNRRTAAVEKGGKANSTTFEGKILHVFKPQGMTDEEEVTMYQIEFKDTSSTKKYIAPWRIREMSTQKIVVAHNGDDFAMPTVETHYKKQIQARANSRALSPLEIFAKKRSSGAVLDALQTLKTVSTQTELDDVQKYYQQQIDEERIQQMKNRAFTTFIKNHGALDMHGLLSVSSSDVDNLLMLLNQKWYGENTIESIMLHSRFLSDIQNYSKYIDLPKDNIGFLNLDTGTPLKHWLRGNAPFYQVAKSDSKVGQQKVYAFLPTMTSIAFNLTGDGDGDTPDRMRRTVMEQKMPNVFIVEDSRAPPYTNARLMFYGHIERKMVLYNLGTYPRMLNPMRAQKSNKRIRQSRYPGILKIVSRDSMYINLMDVFTAKDFVRTRKRPVVSDDAAMASSKMKGLGGLLNQKKKSITYETHKIENQHYGIVKVTDHKKKHVTTTVVGRGDNTHTLEGSQIPDTISEVDAFEEKPEEALQAAEVHALDLMQRDRGFADDPLYTLFSKTKRVRTNFTLHMQDAEWVWKPHFMPKFNSQGGMLLNFRTMFDSLYLLDLRSMSTLLDTLYTHIDELREGLHGTEHEKLLHYCKVNVPVVKLNLLPSLSLHNVMREDSYSNFFRGNFNANNLVDKSNHSVDTTAANQFFSAQKLPSSHPQYIKSCQVVSRTTPSILLNYAENHPSTIKPKIHYKRMCTLVTPKDTYEKVQFSKSSWGMYTTKWKTAHGKALHDYHFNKMSDFRDVDTASKMIIVQRHDELIEDLKRQVEVVEMEYKLIFNDNRFLKPKPKVVCLMKKDEQTVIDIWITNVNADFKVVADESAASDRVVGSGGDGAMRKTHRRYNGVSPHARVSARRGNLSNRPTRRRRSGRTTVHGTRRT